MYISPELYTKLGKKSREKGKGIEIKALSRKEYITKGQDLGLLHLDQ